MASQVGTAVVLQVARCAPDAAGRVSGYLLAIDAGTGSVRAVLFTPQGFSTPWPPRNGRTRTTARPAS